MKFTNQITILLLIITISGCASSGPVPIGKDTYMITKQSAGGIFVTGVVVRSDLIAEAQVHCASQNKEFKMIDSKQQNAVVGQSMPWAEVKYVCLDKNDPRLNAPLKSPGGNNTLLIGQ